MRQGRQGPEHAMQAKTAVSVPDVDFSHPDPAPKIRCYVAWGIHTKGARPVATTRVPKRRQRANLREFPVFLTDTRETRPRDWFADDCFLRHSSNQAIESVRVFKTRASVTHTSSHTS